MKLREQGMQIGSGREERLWLDGVNLFRLLFSFSGVRLEHGISMEGEREREREGCWLIWQHCPRGLPWPCGRAVGMWFLSSVATLHAVLYEVVVRYGTVLSTTLVLQNELFSLLFTTAGSAQCNFSQQISSIFRAMDIHIVQSCTLTLRDCKVCRPIGNCLAWRLANYGPQYLLIRLRGSVVG